MRSPAQRTNVRPDTDSQPGCPCLGPQQQSCLYDHGDHHTYEMNGGSFLIDINRHVAWAFRPSDYMLPCHNVSWKETDHRFLAPPGEIYAKYAKLAENNHRKTTKGSDAIAEEGSNATFLRAWAFLPEGRIQRARSKSSTFQIWSLQSLSFQ